MTVTPQRHIEVMDKISALVNVRERNQKETAERLVKYGFTPEEIADGVETAVRVGIVSDERYARAFIRGKVHAGWGRNKILRRLYEYDISSEIIELCENEFSTPDEEYERAMRELEKRSCHSSDPYSSYMRRLVGKGYSYDVAKRAVKEYLA